MSLVALVVVVTGAELVVSALTVVVLNRVVAARAPAMAAVVTKVFLTCEVMDKSSRIDRLLILKLL